MTWKRWRYVVAAAALALAAAVAWILVAGPPVDRIAELAGDGPVKQLREPMRPHGTGARVLVFALDGVGHDELENALRAGITPRLAAALGAGPAGEMANGWAVPDVLSILPSTTIAAWTSLFTGEPAGRTGVPGNEWFAREDARFHAPAPVSVEGIEDVLALYADGGLGAVVRVPTLYERAGVRSYVSLSQLHRGADLLVMPDLGILGELAAAAVAGLADDDSPEQEAFTRLDTGTAERLVEALREHGVPDLQVVYFPGVDLYTHVAADALADQLRYLAEVLDPAAGAVLDAYRAAGALESTWIVIVSDHGHTPVLNDERHALATDSDRDPPALLERVGFRVRPFALELDDDELDFQAVLAYQGAMAYVYLADRSTCPRPGDICTWTAPPRLQEDVLPVVRAFDQANRSGALVPELRGSVDLIFARQPRPPGEDALPFQVWDGATLVPVGRYLETNPRPELLDLERRLEGLATGPYGHRAGDVLLLSRSGIELPIEERYYFSAKYRSWHGSPSAQDSRIPLMVGRAATPASEIRARVTAAIGSSPSQLDVVRLILALLAGG
jgi:hypothetical protein